MVSFSLPIIDAFLSHACNITLKLTSCVGTLRITHATYYAHTADQVECR